MRIIPLKQTPMPCVGLLAWLLGFFSLTAPAAENAPRVFLMDGARLAGLREHPAKEHRPALEKLRRDAEKALRTEALSVTTKKQTPPSGNKHDYMSLSRYWWPDPSTPDGMPYIRKDGEVNPEISDFPDHDNLDKLVKAVETLALASYLLPSEEYGAKAAELLRAWFINPETRMNPNLDFAQAVPGRATGRGPGVLDGRGFAHIVDAVGLLQFSAPWTVEDQRAMLAWFRQYLAWLQESPNGKAEAAAKNNHGTWYDVQLTAVALFVDDRALAQKTLEAAREKRIAVPIEPDGRQPEELARTRALWYSLFNLEALAELASIGRSARVDLWAFRTEDGRSIRKALTWVLPYTTGEKKWTYDQIDPVPPGTICGPLLHLAAGLRDAAVGDAAARICGDAYRTNRAVLLYGLVEPNKAD